VTFCVNKGQIKLHHAARAITLSYTMASGTGYSKGIIPSKLRLKPYNWVWNFQKEIGCPAQKMPNIHETTKPHENLIMWMHTHIKHL
jgi:hypothetical protein